jgi:hypothetical protein
MRKAKWMDCKLALSFAGSSSTAPVLLNRATKHTQHGSSPNLAIRHALLLHGDGAKQSFRIQRNLAPDARQFLSGIVALLTSAIRVLHAIHVNDQKAYQDLPV